MVRVVAAHTFASLEVVVVCVKRACVCVCVSALPVWLGKSVTRRVQEGSDVGVCSCLAFE